MANMIQKMLEDKKVYKEYEQRVKALPEDYQFVYDKMQTYMWGHAGGSGMDMLESIYTLIEIMEEGVAHNKHVLEITGDDVASFCDELMSGNHLWMDYQRKKLNKKINRIS